MGRIAGLIAIAAGALAVALTVVLLLALAGSGGGGSITPAFTGSGGRGSTTPTSDPVAVYVARLNTEQAKLAAAVAIIARIHATLGR